MDQTYDQARQRIERFFERDHEAIGEYGRSLVFEHGRRTERATLLFHGLSASPPQFIEVARALHARGHNVFIPRLPRHGYSDRLSDAMAGINAEQLIACARDALAVTRGLGERVTVCGFSMGGLLAAYLAQFEPIPLAVPIAPFISVPLIPHVFRLPIARWVLRRPNRFYWWDPIQRERQMPAHGYPRYATHAIGHGLTLAEDLMEAARRAAPLAERITLVINTHETSVSNRAIMRLANAWRLHKPHGVELFRFTDLPYTHDIIEPKRSPEVAKRVLPVIVELIDR